MTAAQGGEERAAEFGQLFRAYVPSVRGFVRTLVRPSEVEQVVSATFETAWVKFDEIPLLSQRAWLFGVARNHVRNHARAERRRLVLVDAIEAMRPAEDVGLFNGRVDPVEVAPLLRALQSLDDDDREIIQLSTWHELTPAEIAEVLGLNSNAVRVRLHRARKRLETAFADESGEVTQ